MKHREHINVACILLAAAEVSCTSKVIGGASRALFPFLKACSGWAALGVAAAYFAGVMFPDVDLYFCPHNHRARSPLHNLTFAAVAFAVSALMCHLYAPSGAVDNVSAAVIFVCAFVFGWLAHLAGDIAQGGVGYIPGSRKRIGNTEYTSERHSVVLDTVLYVAAMCAAAIPWFICRRLPGTAPDIFIAQAACWLIFAHSTRGRSMAVALMTAAASFALCTM